MQNKTKPKNGGGYKCGKSVIVRFSHSLLPSLSPFLIAGNSNPSRGSLSPSFPPLCLPLYSNPVTLSFSASVSLQVGLLGDGKFLRIAGRLKLQSRPHTCTEKRTKHTRDKSMWTPENDTHMWLLNVSFRNHGHSSAAVTASLFWEGFPQEFGTWLQWFSPTQPQEH